jgi:hypothetical protein
VEQLSKKKQKKESLLKKKKKKKKKRKKRKDTTARVRGLFTALAICLIIYRLLLDVDSYCKVMCTSVVLAILLLTVPS